MHTKCGKKGYMAIKVDLDKAYDRLRWTFIRETLEDIGLPSNLINFIMECISSVSMRVLWNGSMTREFNPQRGIRQGRRPSPYILVLCVERLSQKIHELVSVNKRKPLFFKRGQR
jgi:hypothetical protein